MSTLFVINTILLLSLTSSCLSLVRLLSGCKKGKVGDWNSVNVGHYLRSWLGGIVSLGPGEGGVMGGLYDHQTGEWSDYYPGYNDKIKKGDYEVDLDPRSATIMASNLKSRGIAWQWKSKRSVEGFLYTNKLDIHGRFTGDNIIFLYPDLVTGLRGRFVNGEFLEGRSVEVVAERCKNGVKQIKVDNAFDSRVKWVKQEPDTIHPGPHSKVMDPHERRSIYIEDSTINDSGEGLFARRNFLPGDLVSYFGGLKTYPDNFIFDNMTEPERLDAESYFYNIADNCPDWWGVPKGMVIDTPRGMREVTEYRTTLGHKCNNDFLNTNAEYSTVRHPVLGPIACILATHVIEEEEEVLVNYNYDLESAPAFYLRGYIQYKEEN